MPEPKEDNMNTIDLFMWGYQPHFQISAQSAAKFLFKSLDHKLEPNVFLVGVLTEELEDRHPICLEPEDCGYKPENFSDVLEQASYLEAVDEDRFIMQSHPIAQQNQEKRRKDSALLKAISAVVNRWGKYRGKVSFCSGPVFVQGYKVCIVLQLNQEIFNSYYSLANRTIEDGASVSISLLDATIAEYLNECTEALMKPDPGANLGILDRDSDEIIRAAGKSLMYTPAAKGENFEGLHGLFSACNTISSLRYEGAEGIGKIVIAKANHPNIKPTLIFRSPIPLRNFRAVRKLLEISSNENCLLSDSAFIYGLGHVVNLYDPKREDLFIINFTQYYTWELVHADHVLMRVAYRQPQLPRLQIDKQKFDSDLKRIFPEIEVKNIERIWDIILEAIKQKHGTLLVVASDAEKESERLKNQCIRIEPTQLKPNMMLMVTAIDGAVLVDRSATCHAIGVILDGLASKKETPARGARYNSAIRYVESKKECLAIVVSEDGSIDIIPNLRPQISRLAVPGAVAKLRALKESPSVEVKEFNGIMSWLTEHRFYLLPEYCEEINRLRPEIEAKFEKDTTVRILYNDFIPNEEMTESYFLDE